MQKIWPDDDIQQLLDVALRDGEAWVDLIGEHFAYRFRHAVYNFRRGREEYSSTSILLTDLGDSKWRITVRRAEPSPILEIMSANSDE